MNFANIYECIISTSDTLHELFDSLPLLLNNSSVNQPLLPVSSEISKCWGHSLTSSNKLSNRTMIKRLNQQELKGVTSRVTT
jgi:hypothetical protein